MIGAAGPGRTQAQSCLPNNVEMPGEDQNQFSNRDQMPFAPGSVVAHTLWPVASRRARDGNFRSCLKQLMPADPSARWWSKIDCELRTGDHLYRCHYARQLVDKRKLCKFRTSRTAACSRCRRSRQQQAGRYRLLAVKERSLATRSWPTTRDWSMLQRGPRDVGHTSASSMCCTLRQNNY